MADPARKLSSDQTPEDKSWQKAEIEARFHIPANVLNTLEDPYPGITNAAFETTPESSNRQKQYLRLLNLMKDTYEVNAKIMPYELPKITKDLPQIIARLMFPDHKKFDYGNIARKQTQKMSPEYERFIFEIETEAKIPRGGKRPETIAKDLSQQVDKVLKESLEAEAAEEEEEAPKTERELDMNYGPMTQRSPLNQTAGELKDNAPDTEQMSVLSLDIQNSPAPEEAIDLDEKEVEPITIPEGAPTLRSAGVEEVNKQEKEQQEPANVEKDDDLYKAS